MTTQITGDSPQAVAYKLLEDIAAAEGKTLGNAGVEKAWILDTYKECLNAVLSLRRWGAYPG